MISADIPGVTDPEILYHYRLGVFHAVWSTIDITLDMAIGSFLEVTDDEAIMVTWGMMFGPKVKLLKSLVRRSQHAQKQAIITSLNAVLAAKRDVLAHGYQLGGGGQLGFIETARGNDFSTKVHLFTHEEFRFHVDKLIGHANGLQAALAFTPERAQSFSDTAVGLAAKS